MPRHVWSARVSLPQSQQRTSAGVSAGALGANAMRLAASGRSSWARREKKGMCRESASSRGDEMRSLTNVFLRCYDRLLLRGWQPQES
eukprot:3369214-Pleurochrysis_carterae.AAC.1